MAKEFWSHPLDFPNVRVSKMIILAPSILVFMGFLASWKGGYEKLRQHIKKQRYHFVDKFNIVKSVVFSVVMYRCENWTIKEAERWRINAFELCWRRFLRVPWTSWRSNQSILRKINPEYSLEGLMLKLQYFGHLMETFDTEKAGRD